MQSAQASRLGRQLSVRQLSTWRNEDAPGASSSGQVSVKGRGWGQLLNYFQSIKLRRVTSEYIPLRTNGADLRSSANQGNGAMNEVRHGRFSSAPAGVPNTLSVVPEERTRPPVANEVVSASETTDTDALEHQSRSYEVDATRRGPEFSSYQGRASHFRGGSFDTGLRSRPPPSYRTMPGPGSLVAASNGSDYLSPSNSLSRGSSGRK